ncbi:MAG: hypothetical protein H6702_13770 [Myxococcales bacterium]|nr:hypothetical protein [Myxococcales bacterium]
MSQSNRKRRSKGRSRGNTAADHQARANHETVEDSQTFWARSNARLGMDPADANPGRKGVGRQQVDMPCSVCGKEVLCDRLPKSRYDVTCDDCKGALGHMIQGDERDEAIALRRALNPGRNRKHEGIPEFSEEDLDALDEVRARADLGTGRNSNRKGSGGRRRRKKGGSPSGNGNGNGGGGKRSEGGERRRGGPRGGSKGGDQGGGDQGGGDPNGDGNGKRRRRRRRRRGEGGGEGEGASSAPSQAAANG